MWVWLSIAALMVGGAGVAWWLARRDRGAASTLAKAPSNFAKKPGLPLASRAKPAPSSVKAASSNAPALTLPFERVQFEFIILSRSGEPVSDAEFSHQLLLGKAHGPLSREARLLLRGDCLSLQCEQRRFVNGRPHREPEVFRACRHMANVGQINMGPHDHDLITMGRGAFRLRYDGPAAPDQAQLELIVRAAETIRAMRPGLVVDQHARQIWGEHAWLSQLERHNGLGAREHFKIEMNHKHSGVALTTRGLSKFGLPDLRMDNLPPDLSGMGAISMTSIALDLILAESALDPMRLLPAPQVRGHFQFLYTAPSRNNGYPAGCMQMLAGVDDELPGELGLLEVLSRLRRRHTDGERFDNEALDEEVYQKAQDALGRLKQKFLEPAMGQRAFLVRRMGQDAHGHERWFALSAIEGSTFRGLPASGHAAHAADERPAAFDQAEICDWMIMRGGDVEDGGFGMRRQ